MVRQRSEADGRSVTLRLTDKSNESLARDPFEVLVRAVDSLDAKERTAMHHALRQVLTTVAASGAHRRFGVCQDTHLSHFVTSPDCIAATAAPLLGCAERSSPEAACGAPKARGLTANAQTEPS